MNKEMLGKTFEFKLKDGSQATSVKVHSVEKMGKTYWASLGAPENPDSTLWITRCSALRKGSDEHACFIPLKLPTD